MQGDAHAAHDEAATAAVAIILLSTHFRMIREKEKSRQRNVSANRVQVRWAAANGALARGVFVMSL